MNTCPCCKVKSTASFLSVSDYPMTIFPVNGEMRHTVPRKDIDAYFCKTCGHIFTNPLSLDDSKTIYEWLYQFYPSMHNHYRKPFEVFFSSVNKGMVSRNRNRKLLEIGCSSVKLLDSFEKLGYISRGIDPGVSVGDEQGKLIKGYYETHKFSEPFDVLVSRFVLEHVNSVTDFLDKNFNDLRSGGTIFIQVPNIIQFVEEFVPLFLAHEHTNYFNLNSLSIAVRHSGMEIVDCVSRGPSLILALSKKKEVVSHSSSSNITEDHGSVLRKLDNYLLCRESITDEVKKFINSHDEICFYGAGLTLSWILYDLGFSDKGEFANIVDDNELVRGLFMPNSDLKIYGFDEFEWNKCRTVLLTLSSMYHDAVFNKLRENGYDGMIFTISSSGINEYKRH